VPVVRIRDLATRLGDKQIFDGVGFDVPAGSVLAVMGPSGTGKTTLLRHLTGQLPYDAGSVQVFGQEVCALRHRELYDLRRRMGMLFQHGALLTDLDVFDNVAFPLRENTDLPERLIRPLVLMKLQAVGLRGAAHLMPSELSGGMARRVALARAIALDPELILYDEPFVGRGGADPHAQSHAGPDQYRRRTRDRAPAPRRRPPGGAVRRTRHRPGHRGRGAGRHLPDGAAVPAGPERRPGPVPLSRAAAGAGFRPGAGTMIRLPRELGLSLAGFLADLGRMGRFLVRLLAALPSSLRRFGLHVRQLWFIGAMSLTIIMISGLFVGLVMGLQYYQALSQFGATGALGTLTALSLYRELSPVLAALLFAGRAGTAITAEIGLMRSTQQLDAMEMMAVDPLRYVLVPRFLSAIVALPLLCVVFSAMAILGAHLTAVLWLGLDNGTYWSAMVGSVAFADDLLGGVFKAAVFGVLVGLIAVHQGYTARPTGEGVAYATTRTVIHSAIAILAFDFVLTAFLM
jgi:phospholipid/cholesterol/gamma-HCH transport system permease protein